MYAGAGSNWGWGALAFLFGLLLLAAIVVLVLIAVRMLRGGATQQGTGQAGGGFGGARQILDERFARGEIGVEEYHDRRRHLEG